MSTLPYKPVIVLRSWQPLTPEQRRAIFQQWDTSDERFRALWDQLSEEHEAELLAMLNKPGDTDAIHRSIGALRAIVNLKATIMQMKASDT